MIMIEARERIEEGKNFTTKGDERMLNMSHFNEVEEQKFWWINLFNSTDDGESDSVEENDEDCLFSATVSLIV